MIGQYNLNKLTSLFFLMIPSMLWAVWSFKIHNNMFSATGSSDEFYKHETTGILTSGVCPLGKFGAWVIFVWSTIILLLLSSVYTKNDSSQIKTTNIVVGSLNAAIIGIIFILTLIMNRDLWIRTLPFFLTQVGITIILFNEFKPIV